MNIEHNYYYIITFNNLYYVEGSTWTEDMNAAKKFNSEHEAVMVAIRKTGSKVEQIWKEHWKN